MSQKLQGKVAIVTGGASGIGAATALLFAQHGARAVVIADVQDDLGRSVSESIDSHRGAYFHCDVTDEDQVKAMVEWTVETYGALDVMFSNAGAHASPGNQPILDLDLAVLDKVLRINTRGMAACVKHAARKMVELGVRGAIVCTSSVAAEFGNPVNVDYGTSKMAVLGLMRSSFLALGQHGIRINCVSPTLVQTAMSEAVGFTTDEDVAKFNEKFSSLKGAKLTAADVAEAVLYLASESAGFVTGQNLVVDGGLSVWHYD